MNSISNDFVTIEFENEEQQMIAKYCIDIFNSDKELYIGLLNGKTIIHSDELPKLYTLDGLDATLHDPYKKYCIIQSILYSNGIDDVRYTFDKVNIERIYIDILVLAKAIEDERLINCAYYDLAYDYYNMTKDFSYLKKLIYDKSFTIDDAYKIIDYKCTNATDDIIREKIDHEVKAFSILKSLKNDLSGILRLMQKVCYNIEYTNDIINAYMKEDKVDDMHFDEAIPKINMSQFEELVIGSLYYIDPTTKLVEEYLKCKKEGRIHLLEWNPDISSCAYYNDKDDYGIKLYMQGNLTDVITMVHEFGHLHYDRLDNINGVNLGILAEYPSIYYELKTAEYLRNHGYTRKEVEYTKYFRTSSNITNVSSLFPTLVSVYTNMDKDKEDYDVSIIKDAFKNCDETVRELSDRYPDLPVEEQQEWMNQMRMNYQRIMLRPADGEVHVLLYIIGTFFAEDAIDNLKHEDILRILDTIKLNKTNLYDLIKMHRMSPEGWGFTKPQETDGESPKVHKKPDDINQ